MTRRKFWTAASYFPDLRIRMAEQDPPVTRKQLADALGHKSQALVGKWLAGKRGARVESMQRCEDAFERCLGRGGPK